MRKVEAETLEEAYKKASQVLECSISELQCEVLQHPSKGILGFLKKKAIIIAACKKSTSMKYGKNISHEEDVASAIIETVKEDKIADKVQENIEDKSSRKIEERDSVLDSFFETDRSVDDSAVETEIFEKENILYDDLANLIEGQLKELFSHSCFEIDVIEVDVKDDTALIFIDGDDVALLIGKEGYRYNALSYMIFNWLHTKYELLIKLEIAEFLTTQQEMMRNYIKPVIENVEKYGKGKTRSLDGILVQIALEQLREAFPDKCVVIKTGKEDNRFVVVNEFNRKQ